MHHQSDYVVAGTAGEAGEAVSALGKTGPTLNYFFPQSNKDRILINKLENATYQLQSWVLCCAVGGFIRTKPHMSSPPPAMAMFCL